MSFFSPLCLSFTLANLVLVLKMLGTVTIETHTQL